MSRSFPLGISASLALLWVLACSARELAPTPDSEIAPGPALLEATSQRAELDLAQRASWQTVLNWPSDCEASFQATRVGDDAGLEFHLVEPGVWLVAVLCAAGAYEPSYVYQWLDERGAEPRVRTLALPTFESEDGTSLTASSDTEVWGEPVWGEAGELVIVHVSRQTGDCGSWARYAFVDAEPEVRALYARMPCPDPPGDPVDLDATKPPKGWRRIDRW